MENTNEKQVTGVEIAKTATEMAVAQHSGMNDYIQTVELHADNMKDVEAQMASAVAMPFDLTEGYWNPGAENRVGESKRVLFQSIKTVPYLREETNKQTGEITSEEIELRTAYMVELKDGIAKTITNASWKLVKGLESFKPGSAFLITYTGKMKNKSNSNFSDSWSIKPLLIKA